MVEVGMGQQHRVNLAWVVRKRHLVADAFAGRALEHAAIDDDLGPFGLEQILRAGHGRCRAEEVKSQCHEWIVT